MVAEVRPAYDTEWAAMKAVASKLGVGSAQGLRKFPGSPNWREHVAGWGVDDRADTGSVIIQVSNLDRS